MASLVETEGQSGLVVRRWHLPLHTVITGQRHAVLAQAIVRRIQPRVDALPRQEVGVLADFDHASVLQHDALVGPADGGEAVRNDDRGAPMVPENR